MDNIIEFKKEFKKRFQDSDYSYSDEFLYGLISELKAEVETLKKRIESDGK